MNPTSDLQQCGNTVHVVAIDDVSERVSISASSPFAFEADGPSGPGCANVSAAYDGTIGGGRIDLDAAVEPLNSCGLDAEPARCSFSNGTIRRTFNQGDDVILPGGSYAANCRLETACGIRTCSFNAQVTK